VECDGGFDEEDLVAVLLAYIVETNHARVMPPEFRHPLGHAAAPWKSVGCRRDNRSRI
jgi:hypothetical protein